MDLANKDAADFTEIQKGVKYQFHQGFDQIRDPEIPIILRPYIFPPVAVYNGCGSVVFVYWRRLKQFVVPMKAKSHLWL